LRRQVIRRWRKPLVVMAPKSLLRHRECASSLDELAEGRFRNVLPDPEPPTDARRVILCSGKIYYELQEQRREHPDNVAAIIRIEQLYPLAVDEIQAALSPLANGRKFVWVQEEPENMGAWRFLHANWAQHFSEFPLRCIARPASASPATGSKTAHEREQKQLIERALNGE
jgi:2-oxoglutarate dehydrogenase E1 component